MLWDVETGNQLAFLNGHTEDITTLVFSHDGKILASGSQDGTVLLWDWDTKSSQSKHLIIKEIENENRTNPFSSPYC